MAQSTAASVINRHRTLSADQATQQSPVNAVSKNPNRSFPGHPHLFLESAHAKRMSEGTPPASAVTFQKFLNFYPSLDLQSGRLEKFQALLTNPSTTMKELEESSWHGIPPAYRATTWRLLSVY